MSLSGQECKRVFDVDVPGMYLATRAVTPHTRATGYGRIVDTVAPGFTMSDGLLAHDRRLQQLQVLEHRLADESLSLHPAPRIVYRIAEQQAQYGSGPVTLTGPAHVLCFELVAEASAEAKLSAAVELDGEHLIRLDTVSFPPGGVAYLHVHRGPGIRVLLNGAIRIDTDRQSHAYGPLEAWFESGPVPVFAAASESVPTAFVRCMVLPAELQGKRSLRYVRDEDADKPKLQEYRIFVDELLSDAAVAT